MAFRAGRRCVCGAELELPDVSGGAERVQASCQACGQTWEASGWHPVGTPPSAADGPWSAIRSWPDKMSGPYILRYWYEVVGGAPALVGAELWGRDPVERPWPFDAFAKIPPTPLTAEATRLATPELLAGVVDHNVSLRTALRRAWQEAAAADPRRAAALARQKGLDPTNPGDAAGDTLTERLALDEAPERTGRVRTSPETLRQVAEIYRQAVAQRVAYAPAVVTYFAEQGIEITDSTARTWKRKATAGGYLVVPGKKGRPS